MDAVPDSAAVNEAVKLGCQERLPESERICQRSAAQRRPAIPGSQLTRERNRLVRRLSVRYSMPEFLTEKWLEELGRDTAEKMMARVFKRSPSYGAAPGNRGTAEKNVGRAGGTGSFGSPGALRKECLLSGGYDYLGKLKAFRQGRLVVQDVSSMLAAEAAAPAPGSFVLDVCAAPGGKACIWPTWWEKRAGFWPGT